MAQSRVFQRISSGGSRVTELADQAKVTKQTASALVQALEDGGYVERAPDPTDARAQLIRVAPRGAAAIAIAAAEIARIEGEWRRALGSARFDRLTRDLDVLRRLTDH
ncbi:MarR family transcriptional regulator [Sinomonas sp. JC656]|uniref:MarR family transcriptional regulator n=2 Tax=Sinomonas cellulolyticus TaxID=2801916 RepID=A0ABS1K7L5_9MICC|nr:MarR family transcriptional regulator [Sinomonas cellulolyticus]